MEMGMTPELMYGQNVFVPATANPYQYGYAEVGSPMELLTFPGKLPHTSQVSAHLSGNNCLGCAAGSDLQKWAAAEKFQPSSKSSGHLNGTGQKVHSLVDSEKPCNQSSAIIVKSYTSRLPVGNPDGTIIIRTDQYNRDDLRIDYTYAKFFVNKSIGEADVHKSIKYGVWSSSSNGNSKLDSAFRDADRISRRHSTKCPVFLFFCVNGSGTSVA